MPELLRAFIAVQLTESIKDALLAMGHQVQARVAPDTVRWVRPGAMHLTLVFLGDTPVAKLEPIQRVMVSAAADIPAIPLAVAGLGCFPNHYRPRVVWVGVDEPAGHLARIKRSLDALLEPLGFEPEGRPFTPHLTLGRVQKRASKEEMRQLGQVVGSIAVGEIGRMTATHVHLIQSDLRPAGPTYTTLASIPLPSAGNTAAHP